MLGQRCECCGDEQWQHIMEEDGHCSNCTCRCFVYDVRSLASGYAEHRAIADIVDESIVWHVTRLLHMYRFVLSNEVSLQLAILTAFGNYGLPVEREVRLDGQNRIDFVVCGTVGVEVKLKGDARSVARQLARYAESGKVRRVVLTTTRTTHLGVAGLLEAWPVQVPRVPVTVCHLMGSAF